jgi:anthraniloyl-CoA monooxygenase
VDLPLRDGAWGLIAASPLRYTPFSQVPAEMDAGDLQRVRDQFATSAALAAEAGFDALELNFAEGYLVAGFLSPLTNRRRDEHGGALEGRLRFPLAVLDAVRSAWPPERPLLVRLSATDCAAGGLTPADAVTIAAEIAAHGCHLIHVTAGQTTADGTPDYRRGHLTPLSDRIRTEAGVPTLVGGYITTSDEVNTIVGAGRADLCVLETHERREAAQPLAA